MTKPEDESIKGIFESLPRPLIDDHKQESLWSEINHHIDVIEQPKKSPFHYIPKALFASVAVIILAFLLFKPIIMNPASFTVGGSIQSMSIFKGKDILSSKKINNGLLIFYKPQIKLDSRIKSELSVVYLQKTFWGGWHATTFRGGYSTGVTEPLYATYIPSSIPGVKSVLFGEVKNPDIKHINIYGKNTHHKLPISIYTKYAASESDAAKIKEQFWYALVNPNQGPTYKIIAKAKDGKTIDTMTFHTNEPSHTSTTKSFNSQLAITKVIKQHPEFPDHPGTITKKLTTGGPKGSYAKVDFTTSVKKVNDTTYLVSFTKDWHMTVNGTYVKSIWRYQITPTATTTLETKDLDSLPGTIK